MNDVLKTQRRLRLLTVFGQLLFLIVAALIMLAGHVAGGYFFIFIFCLIAVIRLFVFGTLPTVISDCGKLKRGDFCSQSDTLERIEDGRLEDRGLSIYSFNVVKLRKLGWFRFEKRPEIVKKYIGKSVTIVLVGRHFTAIVLPNK